MKSTRRQFVAAGAVAAAAPAFIRAQDKAGTKNPILGSGAHTYEAIHDWGELPSSIKWGNTHGVVEDSQGNIYVHHTVYKDSESPDTMVVFDAKGKFVRSWGKEFRGVAHGLHIRKEGSTEFLYLTVNASNARLNPQPEMSAVVLKTTTKGEIVWKIEGPPPDIDAYKPGPDGKKKAYNPTNVAIAPNGDIYVGDGYGSSYVNQYNSKGEYIRTFGGLGKEAGKLNCPHGLIVDTRAGKDPVLTVADRGNNRIQRFTLDGKHIDFVDGTNQPCHFGYFKNGDTIVPDLGARVTLLDKDNKVIEHLGDDSTTDWRATRKMTRDHFTPGKFVAPHGACFDHAGNIFVVEWVEVGRVTKLRKV